MAVPANAVKCVVSGTLAGAEVFAHSQWFDGTGIVGDDVKMDALSGVITSAIQNNLLVSGFLGLFPSTTHWTQDTEYFYGGGGELVYTAINTINGKAGDVVGSPLPNQNAVVVSLRTDRAGRSYRGRSYLPGIGAGAMQTTGQMSAAQATTIVNAYADFLQAVKDSADGAPPIVCSPTRGAMTPLSYVQVDTRLDTQRSRATRQAATATEFVSIT